MFPKNLSNRLFVNAEVILQILYSACNGWLTFLNSEGIMKEELNYVFVSISFILYFYLKMYASGSPKRKITIFLPDYQHPTTFKFKMGKIWRAKLSFEVLEFSTAEPQRNHVNDSSRITVLLLFRNVFYSAVNESMRKTLRNKFYSVQVVKKIRYVLILWFAIITQCSLF